MVQIELFDSASFTKKTNILNVASVPQRSPFRYAGGKTWLIPQIRCWLSEKGGLNRELIEPFAGGGIVSLTAAFENLVGQVTMVEKDEDVAAVWRMILGDGAEWLADAIMNFHLTPETAREAIGKMHESLASRAFATIIKNRVNRGGILAEGASFIKQGEKDKGITSRWYPATLQKRILAINKIKHKIKFIEGDGFEVCQQHYGSQDVVYFIDPPYPKAGRRLYRYSEIDHEALFDLVTELRGDFLMTYDDTEKVQAMTLARGLEMKPIMMKNTHHTKKRELLIGRNLNWLVI